MIPEGILSPCVAPVFSWQPPETFATTFNLIISKNDITGSTSSVPEGPELYSVAKITAKAQLGQSCRAICTPNPHG